MRATPSEPVLAVRGATLGAAAEWSMPLAFAGTDVEVAAGERGTVLADVSNWGAFSLEGKNSVKFLQGLVTNDIAALAPGEGCYAAFLNVHGRIEAVAHIFSFGDGRLYLRTPPESTSWVSTSLGRFRLAGGFDLVELSDYASVAFLGATASQHVGVLELDPSFPVQSTGLHCAELAYEGERIVVLTIPRSRWFGFDVIGPARAISILAERYLEDGGRRSCGHRRAGCAGDAGGDPADRSGLRHRDRAGRTRRSADRELLQGMLSRSGDCRAYSFSGSAEQAPSPAWW